MSSKSIPHELEPKFIGFRLFGSLEDEGKVRFHEFIDFLEQLRSCLKKIDLSISGSDKPTAYYRIADLEAESASIKLEAVPFSPEVDNAVMILDRVESGIVSIQERGYPPEGFDRELLEAFKGLATPLRKRVRKIEVLRLERTIDITRQLEVNIDRILGEDITAAGSISGYLDAVNVHGVRHFYIYPIVGPTKILCIFPESMLPVVKEAIKSHVNVAGTLRYKMQEVFPHQIDVEDIDIYPPVDELPTLRSIRGMAPNATGSLDSAAFVRALRDASEA